MSKKGGGTDGTGGKEANPYFIYPLNNYDYEYATYVEQNMDPVKLGASPNGWLGTLRKDMEITGGYVAKMIGDPIPTKTSTPFDGVDHSDPVAVARYQCNEQKGPPYKRFERDYPAETYPITGMYSSSYFIQSGFCPVKRARTKTECRQLDPNYTWEGNTCYKPRYAYINNASDAGVLDGTVSSTIREIVDLNPLSFIRITEGKDVKPLREGRPPRYTVVPCSPEEEAFVGTQYPEKASPLLSMSVIALILVLIALYGITRRHS